MYQKNSSQSHFHEIRYVFRQETNMRDINNYKQQGEMFSPPVWLYFSTLRGFLVTTLISNELNQRKPSERKDYYKMKGFPEQCRVRFTFKVLSKFWTDSSKKIQGGIFTGDLYDVGKYLQFFVYYFYRLDKSVDSILYRGNLNQLSSFKFEDQLNQKCYKFIQIKIWTDCKCWRSALHCSV